LKTWTLTPDPLDNQWTLAYHHDDDDGEDGWCVCKTAIHCTKTWCNPSPLSCGDFSPLSSIAAPTSSCHPRTQSCRNGPEQASQRSHRIHLRRILSHNPIAFPSLMIQCLKWSSRQDCVALTATSSISSFDSSPTWREVFGKIRTHGIVCLSPCFLRIMEQTNGWKRFQENVPTDSMLSRLERERASEVFRSIV
jgi:hypothetical protein